MLIFFSNYRNKKEKEKLNKENIQIKQGVKINFKNKKGLLIFINLTSEELMTKEGILKAQKLMFNYLDNNKEVTTVLLGASTKRVFGKTGKKLKERYKNILFTIGDNGTTYLLLKDISEKIKEKRLSKKSNFLVLGASGFLGEQVTKRLSKNGFENIYINTSSRKNSEIIKEKYKNTKIIDKIEEANNIDMVIACTHSKNSLLTKEKIEKIKRKKNKLLIIDVAEPTNLTEEEYEKSKEIIEIRKAGNGYSNNIIYDKETEITNESIKIPDNVAFGCFSEALTLEKSQKYKDIDWFEISEDRMEIIKKLFKENKIETLPFNYIYGKILD